MDEQNWQQVEEWMTLYGDRIIRLVCLVVNDLHLAEEITQEVFIKAFENTPDFRNQASPYTWLYRIAINLSRNYLRRRHRLRFEPWEEELRQSIPEEPLEEQVTRRETGRKIRNCISQLPLRYREVIVLYYYEDLKITDIVKVLEKPEGTIKSHLARGRDALVKVMRKEGLAYAGE